MFDALRSTSRRCFQEAKMFTKSRMDVDTPRLRVSLEREGRYYGYLLAKWGYAQCVVNASLIDVTGRKAAHQCTSSQSVGNAKRYRKLCVCAGLKRQLRGDKRVSYGSLPLDDPMQSGFQTSWSRQIPPAGIRLLPGGNRP